MGLYLGRQKIGNLGETFTPSEVRSVNGKRPEEGNVTLYGTDISVANDDNITITSKIYEIESDVGNISSSIPTKTSQLTNDSGYTTNIGTITGITMNGSSKGTSGNVNLGTVLTAVPNIDASKITSGTIGSDRIPKASSSTLGGVKINGNNLAILSDGTLSAASGGGGGGGSTGYTLTLKANQSCSRPENMPQNVRIYFANGSYEDKSYSTVTTTDIKTNVIGVCLYSSSFNPSYIDFKNYGAWGGGNNYFIPIYQDTTITFSTGCIIKGSKITFSDYSEKNIEDVSYDDELLVWNFDEHKFDAAKPLWIKKQQTALHYWENVFEDGTILKTTGNEYGHRFFSIEDQKFIPNVECLGKHVFKNDGTSVKMVSCEHKSEIVEYYNIITEKHFNCFANGLLTSTRLNNLHRIQDMKFVKEESANRSLEDYDVQIKYFNGLRLSEQTGDVNEINEYVKNLMRTEK